MNAVGVGTAPRTPLPITPALVIDGSPRERLAVFRRVRDGIRDRLRLFILAGGREDIQVPEPTILR